MDTCEALDLSKENIQPLKQGRNPSQLGTALQAQTNSEVHQQLTKQQEKYELNIRLYDGDDPLEPRYEYVAWLEQSYPKHGPESNLIPLLEDTLTTFKDDERYRQDPRFVELLVKYFDTQPNPLELYQVVYSQGLGTMCALFYRAWADEFDKNNDMLRADQIYQLGIKNRAQPLDQLIEFHKHFQFSVGRRTLGYNDTYPEESEPYARGALGRIKSKNKVPSVRETKGAPGTWPLGPNNSLNHNQKAKAPVKVYQEYSDNENYPTVGIEADGVFPTQESLQKENRMKPGTWTGQLHKTKPVPKLPSTPAFQVHEDEDESSCPQRPGAVVPHALKPKKQDTFTCPLAVFEPPDPTKKAMYCKHKVYVGSREYQFEELRAAEYIRRLEQRRSMETLVPNKIQDEQVDDLKIKETEVLPKIDSISKSAEKNDSEITIKEEENPDHNMIPTVSKISDNGNNQRMDEENAKPKQNEALLVEPMTDAEIVHVPPLFSASEEPEHVHSIFSEKKNQTLRMDASLTTNTKAAIDLVVQEMWNSSSPVQVTSKQRRRTFLPSTDEYSNGVFKVPVVPQPKMLPFTLFTDEKSAATSAIPNPVDSINTAVTNKCQQFSTLDDANSHKEQNKRQTFSVYTDHCESNGPLCDGFGLPGDETQKELDQIEFNKKPILQDKPRFSLISDVIKPSHVNPESKKESVYCNTDNGHSEYVFDKPSGQQSVYPSDGSISQRKDVNQSDKNLILHTPFIQSEVKENFPQLIPQFHLQQPQLNAEDNDGDLSNITCNTKAFAFALPSSTPMNGHFQTAASHQANISYVAEELLQKAIPAAKNLELSKISEVSNERATSSSNSSNGAGGTQVSQDSELNEIKQRPCISSEDNADIKRSIANLSINGNIDPFSAEIISQLLTLVGYPKLCHMPGIHKIDEDLNFIRGNSNVKLGSTNYVVRGEMCKGAYAKVLKAMKHDKCVALKYQKPACIWELYIVQELHLRLRKIQSDMIGGFMEIDNAYLMRNSSVFETQWATYGNLLDVTKTWKLKTDRCIPLKIVVIISIQMTSIIDHLHMCKIIHGDIKPDNFVLSSLPSIEDNRICVKLIDFGRSIDMTLLPQGTTFTTVVTTDGFTCTEMLDKKPWTYQIDTFGLVGTIVLLLTGEYMKVVKSGNKWKLSHLLPRYCMRDLWSPIISSLLNTESCDKQANLADCKKSLQTYLESVDCGPLEQELNTFGNVLNGW